MFSAKLAHLMIYTIYSVWLYFLCVTLAIFNMCDMVSFSFVITIQGSMISGKLGIGILYPGHFFVMKKMKLCWLSDLKNIMF